MKKVDFFHLEETRLNAGFFVREVCEKLGISEQTWYRWRRTGRAPQWAKIGVSAICGDLEIVGWRGFFIERGVLYNRDLCRKYYSWKPGDLRAEAFLRANGYGLKMRRYGVNQGADRQSANVYTLPADWQRRENGPGMPQDRI